MGFLGGVFEFGFEGGEGVFGYKVRRVWVVSLGVAFDLVWLKRGLGRCVWVLDLETYLGLFMGMED